MSQDLTFEEKIIWLRTKAPDTLATSLGIEVTLLEPDRVCGTMPVDARTRQPFGILHGGASVALAETLCSLGAWLSIDATTHTAVGLEINANHIRAVKSGIVFGEAIPIHKGRRTQVWQITIKDGEQKLVCHSKCTMAVVENHAANTVENHAANTVENHAANTVGNRAEETVENCPESKMEKGSE